MSKGRRVPPPKRVPGLGECDCDACTRIDRILARELSQVEARALTGYHEAGRGAVGVALCRDCGDHIADDRPDGGVTYIPQPLTRQWHSAARAAIATYSPETEYVVMVMDASLDKVTMRHLSYTPPTPAA